MNNAEERMSDLEDRIMEIFQSREQTENQMKKKHEINIRDLWDNIKQANLYIKGFQKEKKRVLKIYFKKLWLKMFQI